MGRGMGRAVLAVIFVWGLACSAGAAEADWPAVARAGQPLAVTLTVGPELAAAPALMLGLGGGRFRPLSATRDPRGRWQVTIPAEAVRPPALVLFWQWTDAAGERRSLPARYPRYNPHRLPVEPQTDALTAQWDGERLRLKGLRQPPQAVWLDQVDVTEVAAWNGTWQLAPAEPPAAGSHELRLVDAQGRTHRLAFDVAAAGAPGTRRARLEGSGSVDYGGQVQSEGSGGGDRLSGNLGLAAALEAGDAELRFEGFNLQYDRNATEDFTVGSGYLLTARWRGDEVRIGDVAPAGVPLVVSGFARRGAEIALNRGSLTTRVFNVRTQPVAGNTAGLAFDDRRQTYGAHVAAEGQRGRLEVTAVTGARPDDGGAGVTSIEGAHEGSAAGLAYSGEWAGTALDAELAWSRLEPDGAGARSDVAAELRLGRDIAGAALGLGLVHHGADYASLANPNFSNDQQSADLSLASGIGILSWSLNASLAQDNVERDAGRPVIRSLQSGVNLGLTPAGWPSVQLALSAARNRSSREPDAASRVDNENRSVSLNLSQGLGALSLTLGGTLSELDDGLDPARDAETRGVNLAASWSRGRFSVSPALSIDRTERAAQSDETRLATLNLAIPLWTEALTLSAQGSWQQSEQAEGEAETAGASARLAWALADLIDRELPQWLNFAFTLSSDYQRSEPASGGAVTEDYTVLLGFTLGSPFHFALERAF